MAHIYIYIYDTVPLFPPPGGGRVGYPYPRPWRRGLWNWKLYHIYIYICDWYKLGLFGRFPVTRIPQAILYRIGAMTSRHVELHPARYKPIPQTEITPITCIVKRNFGSHTHARLSGSRCKAAGVEEISHSPFDTYEHVQSIFAGWPGQEKQ